MGWFNKSDDKQKQFAEQFFRARAEKCRQILRESTASVRRLPVLDAMTTPLLHLPVYDCATDVFELPCAHPEFEDTILFGDYGFEKVEEWLHRCSSENADPELHAFIDCGDHVVILFNQTSEPGGEAWRFVRIGENAFHAHYWRAGMNPGAYNVDPPFFVKEVHRDPSIWVRREKDVALKCQGNPNYQYEARQCKHLHSSYEYGDALKILS
jgi:hypothetical protein